MVLDEGLEGKLGRVGGNGVWGRLGEWAFFQDIVCWFARTATRDTTVLKINPILSWTSLESCYLLGLPDLHYILISWVLTQRDLDCVPGRSTRRCVPTTNTTRMWPAAHGCSELNGGCVHLGEIPEGKVRVTWSSWSIYWWHLWSLD